MQQMIFIAYLIACSTCFGHHYTDYQELESIIQVVPACVIWCFGFQVVCMDGTSSILTVLGSGHQNLHETYQCRMYSRELLMMGREDTRIM